MNVIEIGLDDWALVKQIESDYLNEGAFLKVITKATYLNGKQICIIYANGIMHEDENQARHSAYKNNWDNKLVQKIAKKYDCLIDGYDIYCLHGNLIKLVQCITAIDVAFGVVKK
ncbi:hypothetical protein SY212_22010 [Ligilactobacillus agilis]|uniref:Uncharacterized protein n=1 Tax=Ligilactobacillus agilis TaxID=1601 RepID=A0A6F9XPG8_9LACO|nr:hypothetical protein [Ligilactobacillus agilis]GET07171.1 hypothetical protein SY212_22010 [Ligilactobacillus agilis]